MNRTCCGSFYTVNSKIYYRCLADGTMVQGIGSESLIICPACNRLCTPTSTEAPIVPIQRTEQVRINGTWQNFNPKTFVNPIFTIEEAEVLVSLLDERAKQAGKQQDFYRDIITKIQTVPSYLNHHGVKTTS